MNTGGSALSALTFMVLAGLTGAAQRASGQLGSSDAITTIDGDYLRLSPPNFGGVIPTPALDWIVIVQSICA
jgi:hypothetical protein